MLISKIMVTAGCIALGSLLCHQRLKRRGQELTHMWAKLMLVGLDLVLCGIIVRVFS